MAENDKLLGLHVAEDDDAQRVRAWWKKNGMGIVAGGAIGVVGVGGFKGWQAYTCLLYTSPSPRDYAASRMPSSA